VVELASDTQETSACKNGFFRRTFNLLGTLVL